MEISGRIDTDEAAEEEQLELEAEEGGGQGGNRRQNEDTNADAVGDSAIDENANKASKSKVAASPPLQRVWPYLARIFHRILADVESRKTLPFNVSRMRGTIIMTGKKPHHFSQREINFCWKKIERFFHRICF